MNNPDLFHLDMAIFDARVYYSQNREDLILDCFFDSQEKGFYVDVGAFDPDYDSVTKLFYKRGWKGINFEPQKDKYEQFKKRRRRDVNLNVGVSNEPGTLTLYSYASQGLSTLSPEINHNYLDSNSPDTNVIASYDVSVVTLKDVFKQQHVTSIQFMKVDVEGMEFEVLEGNDWDVFRPEVLCIETSNVLKPWFKLVESKGYELVFFDGLNNYYADKKTDRAKRFNYIQHVVAERGGGIRIEDYTLIDRLHRAYKDAYEHLGHKENHVVELAHQRAMLLEELDHLKDKQLSVKYLSKKLTQTIVKRLGFGKANQS